MKKSIKTFLKSAAKDTTARSANPAIVRASTIYFKTMQEMRKHQKNIAKGKDVDYSEGIAITSGIYPDKNTHIETCRYGKGQGAMSLLATLLVDKHEYVPRPVLWLWKIIRHPLVFLRSMNPIGVSEKSTYVLVMQTISNYMRFNYQRRWWRLGKRSMNSDCDTDQKVPAYIPVANEYTKRLAEKIDGDPAASITEIFLNTLSTNFLYIFSFSNYY